MNKTLKESYATLLAYIIQIDKDEVSHQEATLFCMLMNDNFGCNKDEALTFLKGRRVKEEDFQKALDAINKVLEKNPLDKMHLLEQMNHIIYSDGIAEDEYEGFERVKKILFSEL